MRIKASAVTDSVRGEQGARAGAELLALSWAFTYFQSKGVLSKELPTTCRLRAEKHAQSGRHSKVLVKKLG
jgi:hypothetical protein